MQEDYIDILKKRGKESKVYSSHQMIGLMIAEILDDPSHKSLYMRLAKNNDEDVLLSLAKSVADRKNVKNKGAYFMKLFKSEKQKRPHKM